MIAFPIMGALALGTILLALAIGLAEIRSPALSNLMAFAAACAAGVGVLVLLGKVY